MSTFLKDPNAIPSVSDDLTVARLLDNCTPSIAYDEQIQAACKAFDNQMFEIITDTGQVLFIPNIMAIEDETLIDILAWQFHVDLYDKTKPFEFRKELVQMSFVWHRTKGTVALVNDVINTYWPGGGYIQEWFDYHTPFPPNYPVDDADLFIDTFGPTNINVPNDKFLYQNTLEGGEAIFVRAGHGATAGTLPAPLVADTTYWIVNPTSGSFQLAATLGGAPINFTSAGTGVNEFWKRGFGTWHDRYRFRVIVNGDIIPAGEVPALMDLINRYKPISRWPEGEALGSISSVGTVYAFGWALLTVTIQSAAADIRS